MPTCTAWFGCQITFQTAGWSRFASQLPPQAASALQEPFGNEQGDRAEEPAAVESESVVRTHVGAKKEKEAHGRHTDTDRHRHARARTNARTHESCGTRRETERVTGMVMVLGAMLPAGRFHVTHHCPNPLQKRGSVTKRRRPRNPNSPAVTPTGAGAGRYWRRRGGPAAATTTITAAATTATATAAAAPTCRCCRVGGLSGCPGPQQQRASPSSSSTTSSTATVGARRCCCMLRCLCFCNGCIPGLCQRQRCHKHAAFGCTIRMVHARVIAWGGYESMHGRWPAQLTRFKGSERACTSLKRARGSEGEGEGGKE